MTKRGKDGDYKVGRGKPPVEHRFPKGRSGNPNGRPKKVCGEVLDPENPDIIGLIISEGCRLITLNEGGNPVTMPMIQAVYRATGVSALKGNAVAQRNYSQQFSNAVAQQAKFKLDERMAAIELKMRLELKRDRWVAAGNDEMAIDQHPSDVEISAEGVKSYLALTAEGLQARATLVEHRDHALEFLARTLKVETEHGADALSKLDREFAEQQIKRMNEGLPPRFRRPAPSDTQWLTVGTSPQDVWATYAERQQGTLVPAQAGLS